MNLYFLRQHLDYVRERSQGLFFTQKNAQWNKMLQRTTKQFAVSEQQATQMIKQRIKGFFYPQYQLDTDQTFKPRIDVDYSDKKLTVFKNILVLYGIDFLSKSLIHKYFATFDICLENFNSSNCRVIFRNHEEALSALVCNLKSDQIRQKILFNSMSIQQVYQNWFEILPYYEFCFQKKLYARFATDKDFDEIKNNKVIQFSHFNKYLQKKDKFMTFFENWSRRDMHFKKNKFRKGSPYRMSRRSRYSDQQSSSNSFSRHFRKDNVPICPPTIFKRSQSVERSRDRSYRGKRALIQSSSSSRHSDSIELKSPYSLSLTTNASKLHKNIYSIREKTEQQNMVSAKKSQMRNPKPKNLWQRKQQGQGQYNKLFKQQSEQVNIFDWRSRNQQEKEVKKEYFYDILFKDQKLKKKQKQEEQEIFSDKNFQDYLEKMKINTSLIKNSFSLNVSSEPSITKEEDLEFFEKNV